MAQGKKLQDLLSQEEINALLNGIEGEAVADDPDEQELTEVIACEPGELDRLERSDMPGLELFAQRLARHLQTKLFKWFEGAVTVNPAGQRQSRFQDYRETVNEPVSINLLHTPPLHGTSMLVLDSKLVFKLVDQFFGGASGHARIESRVFSSLEQRVISLFIEQAFSSMVYAWQPLQQVSPVLYGSESSTEAIAAMAPEEPLVISSFDIAFDGSGGELQWVAPYAMLEPLREQLTAGLGTNSDTLPGHWQKRLASGLKASKLNMHYVMQSKQLSLQQLVQLEAGDIVPIDENSGIISVNARHLFKAGIKRVGDDLAVDILGRVDQ